MINKIKIICVCFVSVGLIFFCHGLVEAKDAIKIGVVHNYTDISGKSIKEGAILAKEHINKEGGIFVKEYGKKLPVELFFANDGARAHISAAAAEKLCAVDKVDFLVGANVTELTLAQQEVSADYKKIFLSSGAAGMQLCANVEKNYDRYKYYFKYECLDSMQLAKGFLSLAVLTAKEIGKQLGIPLKDVKTAVLAEHAEWAEPVVKYVTKGMKEAGINIVYVARPSRDSLDLTTELIEATSKGAIYAWVCFSVEAGYALVKNIYDLQLPIVTTGWNSVAQDLGGFWKATAGKGIYAMTFTSATPRLALTPKTIPFYDAHVKRWGFPPRTYRGNAEYNNMMILKTAIEKAGSLDTDKIIHELENITYVGLLGTNKVDPKTHNSIAGEGYLPENLTIQWIAGGKQQLVLPEYLATEKMQLPPALLKLYNK